MISLKVKCATIFIHNEHLQVWKDLFSIPGWFKNQSFSVQLVFGAVTLLHQSQYSVCCNNEKLKHIVLLTQK